MRKIGLLWMILGLAWGAGIARAQNGSGLPPIIVQFGCDRDSVTLADVEDGTATITFTWQTAGMTDQQHVALYQDQQGWSRVDDPNSPLPASGSYETTLRHPFNFAPPTYRLVIEDLGGIALDKWFLTIPYEPGSATPEIVSFAPAAPSIDINQVIGGTVYIGVSWDVDGRQPLTNLLFEQLFADGRTASAELARANQWTSSRGTGTLQLAFTSQAEPLRVRMRLVDLQDNRVLDEAEISLAVTGTLAPPPPTPVPPPPVPVVPDSGGPQVMRFTVTPDMVNLGESVTVAWDVRGATQIGINQISLDGPIMAFAPNPGPSGSWTAAITWYYRPGDTAFMLYAQDAAGRTVTQTLGVTVRCPASFFFAEASGRCPTGPASSVPAAFQPFQHGMMVWWSDSKKITILYGEGSGGALDVVADQWAGEEIAIPETPPAGLYAPQRGFGKVWSENSAVRAQLGWATAPEQAYTVTTQAQAGNRYAPIYFTLPGGRIVSTIWNTWKYYGS